jgi:hypothetical protein
MENEEKPNPSLFLNVMKTMKRYIFCEAWRQYKMHDNKSFKTCLSRVHKLAKMLKSSDFDFNKAWCNK